MAFNIHISLRALDACRSSRGFQKKPPGKVAAKMKFHSALFGRHNNRGAHCCKAYLAFDDATEES
jgi:hypothetical protein